MEKSENYSSSITRKTLMKKVKRLNQVIKQLAEIGKERIRRVVKK